MMKMMILTIQVTYMVDWDGVVTTFLDFVWRY
jgi:hypothetical protein